MKLRIDFELQTTRLGHYVLVCIKRGNRNRITYNSGLLYFQHEEAVQLFTEKVRKGDPSIEIKTVDVREAHEPTGEVGKGYWCPYCQSWEYWFTDSGGYKRCPVCKMSNNDFYVKKYNNLWNNEMKSKSAKKKSEAVQVKIKRRKRKENKE